MPSLFTRHETTDEERTRRGVLRQTLRNRSPYARTWWAKYFPTRAKARKAIFYTLLGSSAVFGSLFGLLLVNSADMPQMEELERFRPSTKTDLLDVHGRVFGSFALERRLVVT